MRVLVNNVTMGRTEVVNNSACFVRVTSWGCMLIFFLQI
jgi:hypothetical protein